MHAQAATCLTIPAVRSHGLPLCQRGTQKLPSGCKKLMREIFPNG